MSGSFRQIFSEELQLQAGKDSQDKFSRETRNKDSSVAEKGEVEVLNIRAN